MDSKKIIEEILNQIPTQEEKRYVFRGENNAE